MSNESCPATGGDPCALVLAVKEDVVELKREVRAIVDAVDRQSAKLGDAISELRDRDREREASIADTKAEVRLLRECMEKLSDRLREFNLPDPTRLEAALSKIERITPIVEGMQPTVEEMKKAGRQGGTVVAVLAGTILIILKALGITF